VRQLRSGCRARRLRPRTRHGRDQAWRRPAAADCERSARCRLRHASQPSCEARWPTVERDDT